MNGSVETLQTVFTKNRAEELGQDVWKNFVVPPFFDWAFDGLYTGRENDRTVLPAFGLRRSQSSQLTAAISLAYCQPAVSAFFNFEVIDETRLVGWQSGLLYANGIRKPSFGASPRTRSRRAPARSTRPASTRKTSSTCSVRPACWGS